MLNQFDKHDPEIEELILSCMHSSIKFDKTLFPEEVQSDFSSLHHEIFKVIDAKHNKKAIAAPRGLGKTTLAKLRVIKAILFRETNFIIYLSNSASSAEMQTESIKRMIQQSELIRTMFGDIKFSKDGWKDSFSKQSWVAYGDVFVLPRGAGQQVRGLNWMGHRPGLIVIDDLESTELVRSDEQREKLALWFFSDLMKTESKFGDPAEFLYIDTVKHEDSLLQNLIDAEDWLNVDTPTGVLSICDENHNTYDPNYMTTEEIKKSYAEHKALGKTDLFYMEYMNIPISKEDAIFKEEYFKYFEEMGDHLRVPNDLLGVREVNGTQNVNGTGKRSPYEKIWVKDLITIVLVDPARTVKLQSAESAVVTVSVSRSGGKIFVRDVFAEKVRPDELYEAIFKTVLLHNAMILAVEVTGLHEFISQPLQNQMRVRGIYPKYIELNAKGDKDARIATLAPNYRLGYMYHNKSNCTALEGQLEWHPKSKRKDIIDALAYINKVMDEQAMFFDPIDDEDFDQLDEFEELEDEALLADEYCII